MKKQIHVTKPFLPPLEEFIPYLEKIWHSKVLTNKGPFHEQFEIELCKYFGVEHLSLLTNGTLSLMTALQALRINGEVITTPYTFVATAHSLLWNNIKPVFVDVDPTTCNIDPNKIESAITSRTTAILPIHCYGNPCNVELIQKIADNYNLKVIYDAAHAFGVKYKGKSLLAYGDLSILSFHATKVFNTFEGGAIICSDAKIKQHIDHLKNFGFTDETTVVAPGINGKMSEFNAALGLLQLKHINNILKKREIIDKKYRYILGNTKGIYIPPLNSADIRNYSYFPIFIEDEFPLSRDRLYQKLKDNNINARRYFYPIASSFPMYRELPGSQQDCLKIAKTLSERVICLPIYPELEDEDIENICLAIKE